MTIIWHKYKESCKSHIRICPSITFVLITYHIFNHTYRSQPEKVFIKAVQTELHREHDLTNLRYAEICTYVVNYYIIIVELAFLPEHSIRTIRHERDTCLTYHNGVQLFQTIDVLVYLRITYFRSDIQQDVFVHQLVSQYILQNFI